MKKIKAIRINPEPARGQSGINPLDPWGAKAGISEEQLDEVSARASEADLLSRYLKSRGINPEYVPKNTKVAHSKSSEFMKWKSDHTKDQFESIEVYEAKDKTDTVTLNIPLVIRMLELAREDIKSDADLHKVIEKLISIRDKGTLTMDDYEFVSNIKEVYQLPTATQSDHDHVKQHLSRVMGVHSSPEEKSSVPAVHRAIKKVSGISDSSTRRMSKDILKSLISKHRIVVDKDHRQILNKESTQINELSPATKTAYKEKAKQTIAQLKPHAKSGEYKDIAQNIINRREKGLAMAKEEIEQIEERNKQNAMKRQASDAARGHSIRLKSVLSGKEITPPKAGHKSTQDYSKAIGRESRKMEESSAYGRISSRFKALSGRSLDAAAKEHGDEAKRLQKEIEAQQKEIDRRKAAMKNEEVEQIDEMEKKEYSKSARIIKSIYKRKHMKEDMYDFEKGDKQQSQDDNAGDDRKRPKAKAVMTGGKTMTGQKRDDVEIDPQLARKPDTPDGFEKGYGKKSV